MQGEDIVNGVKSLYKDYEILLIKNEDCQKKIENYVFSNAFRNPE